MALMSNKTAIESILGNFEKKHVDAVYNAAAQTIISHSEFRNKHFAYALTSYQKKIASKVGIELYPNGYMPHSHPLSKIFENHILFDVLPDVVSTSKLIMCSIKESKVLIFKNIRDRKKDNGALGFCGKDTSASDHTSFINRLVASKDIRRYTEEADAFFSSKKKNDPELFSNNFIRCISNKEAVFFHDEVHHWTKAQMFSFLKRTKVRRFIFTIVYPPELLKKFANSQNPKVYDFKVDKGRLFFFPDGVKTEAYEQKLNMEWLFSASHFKSGDQTWTVTRHKSIYSHHLFEVSMGELISDSKIFFSDYGSIDMSKIFLDRFRSYEVFPIAIEHLYKVYSYLLCLKKPDLESGLAKLRQIIGDDVEIKEFLFFEQFCKRLIERQTSWGLFGYSFFDKLTDLALSKMPNVVARMFPQWKKKNTFEFLFSLGTLVVEIERRVCFEHILEEWGFEVVITDENAYLDPLSVFALNENFNEERVDDGYLDRVKLPFWNLKDYDPKRGRANKYDLLCYKFEEERKNDLRERGPHKMLQIEWYGIREFDDPFIANGISEFTILEALIGKRIHKERYSYSKQADVLAKCLSFVCEIGGGGEGLEFVLERRLQSAGRDPIESESEGLGKKTAESSGEADAANTLLETQISGLVAFIPTFSDEGESQHRADLEVESEGEIGKEESFEEGTLSCAEGHEAIKFEIDFSDIFRPHNCMNTHGYEIPTPMDGNCFFSAFAATFDCPDSKDLRSNFADWLDTFDGGSYADMGVKIRPNGVFMEAELIYLFCIYREVTLIMHDRTNDRESVFAIHLGFEEGHMVQRGDHFLGIETYRIDGFASDPNLSELPCGYSEELRNFHFKPEHFNCAQFRGRKGAFLTKVDADYGHNGMVYPHNAWVPSLDEIIRICDHGDDFNCALINFYGPNSSLGFHRDNERVYNDDPILTVCTEGEGFFSIEFKEQTASFLMTAGSFFLMPRGFQRKARHSVRNELPRVSITFRKHIRRLDGSPIAIRQDNYRNVCLIRALSKALNRGMQAIIAKLKTVNNPFWSRFLSDGNGGSVEDCLAACEALGITVDLFVDGKCLVLGEGAVRVSLALKDNHFSVVEEHRSIQRTFVSHLAKKSNLRVMDGLDEMLQSEMSTGVNCVQFIADFEHARVLANSFLNMTTGICLSRALDNGEKYFLHMSEERPKQIGFDVTAICGFAGSGKSRQLQSWLHARKRGNFCVVSPRNNLAADWSFKLELEPNEKRKVATFESFIKMDKSKLDMIVLDELTLFPNGYLDLLIYELDKFNSHCHLILLFDPLQARYHNKMDEAVLNFEHDVDRLIGGQDLRYIYSSHRMSKYFNRFFDVPCFNQAETTKEQRLWILDDVYSITSVCIDQGEPCDVLLVESDLEKKAFSPVINVMTFGESQGLTFNHVCILLSESSAASNEFRWMVALTRAKTRLSFCSTFLGGMDEFKIKRGESLVTSILEGKQITFERSNMMVKCNLIKQEKKNGCSDEVDREERLEGDPFLKPFIFLGHRIQKSHDEVGEIEVREPTCQTHLYITEPNFGLCYNFDFIREKEQREYREDMLVTNQFCDSYDKVHINGKRETPGPLRFKAIYPKHSADDDMTFWMAVKKRLVFREEEENYQRLSRAHLVGGLLYRNFKNKLGLEFTFDQGLFEESVNAFEKKKLEKSCGTIKSHSIRSDVDWALNDVFLFMKSQLCTKYEKQFVDAKAGQTLACFQHLILVQFAPWCRYLEAQIRNQLPEEIYIHSNKNFDDLNRWVKNFFQKDICVESDYEAFDACQDEYILSFEIHLMKDAHFPQRVIDAYIDLKCKLGCKLGHFSIMRFTGEFCTFLFNTLANIAFTLCRYEWRRGQPIAFAGDDMCALNNLPICHDFDDLFELISLKAKVERTESPMFCGWRLTPYGIVKEPELVYNRFQIAIEEGKVMECLENYAIEVSYAYSLSERLYEVLKSERQIQYHQAVVRFIVTHIDKLKTRVKDLFLEQSSDEDI
uniref:ORF1 protein n=1 Tax=Citrus leaf blotch virus TaxID=129141 RepID=H6VXL1_9VIRU|nr:replicase polyprotein [Citrus leaf blotch virus]